MKQLKQLDEKTVEKLKSTVFGNSESLFTKVAKAFIAAHSLKSSSATLGALYLSEIAEEIESLAHQDNPNWEKIEHTAAEVQPSFDTVCKLLKKELDAES